MLLERTKPAWRRAELRDGRKMGSEYPSLCPRTKAHRYLSCMCQYLPFFLNHLQLGFLSLAADGVLINQVGIIILVIERKREEGSERFHNLARTTHELAKFSLWFILFWSIHAFRTPCSPSEGLLPTTSGDTTLSTPFPPTTSHTAQDVGTPSIRSSIHSFLPKV